MLLLRRGRTEAGLRSIRRARGLFARIGYRDDVAATEGLEGEAILQTGQTEAAFDPVHRALLQLRQSPTSLWRHNVLLVLSHAAERAGLHRAAMAAEDEDAAIAGAGLTAVSVTEARLARARSLWLSGRPAAARAATEDARRVLAAVTVADARAQLQHDMELTTAVMMLRSHPDSARRMLDSVVAFFAPLHYAGKTISALVTRAAAALAERDEAAAEGDLTHAASLYDAAKGDITDPGQRAALVAAAHSVFDELVMLRLRTGRRHDALAAVEAGRLSFTGRRRAMRRGGTADDTPRGMVIDYALIGDTLLAWVVGPHDTTLIRSRVEHERLLKAAERARAGLELGAAEKAVRSDLEQLYDWLLRPIATLIPPDGTITIVADGDLLGVPWAALRDRDRNEYLVERRAARLAPTLADAYARDDDQSPLSSSLVVSAPALDWHRFPELAPLPGADAEGRVLEEIYPRSVLLDGADADSAHVVAALRTTELFHFAGHAVFDDAQPDRSYLAIGPRGLSATAIARLDLHQLRLVVLSACQTMRSADRPAGGFAGLATAFLAAGARGVVGSLWPVDDAATRSFMAQFYRAYHASGDVAMALRTAQVAMIRGGEPPSTWAAFTYEGQ